VPVDYAVVLPKVDACLHRIRTRLGHEFHDEDAARSLHEQFATGQLDARHVIDSTDQSAEEIANSIEARRDAGSLRVR